MTDRAKELIARVRELDKAATPGPWRRGSGNEYREVTNSHGGIVADRIAANDGDFVAFSRTALPDLATLAEQAIARAEKAEADLAEARRMLKEAEHGRNDAEHDLVEGISYIRQTSRYVNDDRDCRAAWSWADDLQQRHDARVNARHQAREGR